MGTIMSMGFNASHQRLVHRMTKEYARSLQRGMKLVTYREELRQGWVSGARAMANATRGTVRIVVCGPGSA